MKFPVLIAADGAAWEAAFVLALERGDEPVEVVRRCVDVIDLLAVALSGQARAALVSAGLRRLDADAVDRLLAAGVAPVGVFHRDDTAAEDALRAMGIVHVVPDDAEPTVVALVIVQAVTQSDHGASRQAMHAFTGVSAAVSAVGEAPAPVLPTDSEPARRGSVIAVWGPTGAPGRTTVAVGLAEELSRFERPSLLVDADCYGGVTASLLGLLDESPGLAAACRQAGVSRLDPEGLAALCWQISPHFRVLTGIPRADRWPELRPSAIDNVLDAARQLADFVVIDCGFSLEADEELTFDALGPRRNGMTLAALDRADVLVAVGAADPIGLQRMVRGLAELRDAEIATPVWAVLNKVRRSVVPGDPSAELTAALERFAGRTPAALLPFDQAGLDGALSAGKTLAESSPNSPLRLALVELAGALAGHSLPGRRRRR